METTHFSNSPRSRLFMLSCLIPLLVNARLYGQSESPMQEAPGASARIQIIVSTPECEGREPPMIYGATCDDGWRPDGRKLERVAPNLYVAEWRIPVSTTWSTSFSASLLGARSRKARRARRSRIGSWN